MISHFIDIQSVEAEAQKVVNNILSDKSYINPQKFHQVLLQYQKRQARLDAEVSAGIKNQIENIKNAKKYIDQANKSISQERTIQINTIWNRESDFHTAFPEIYKLFTYKKNIGTVIYQLQNFVALGPSLSTVESLMQQQSNFELVNTKIMNLIDLRDNVIQKLSSQRSSKEVAIIRKQFEGLQKIQKTFYQKVFDKFKYCIKIAKTNPMSLIKMVSIVETGDRILQEKSKQSVMKERALVTIAEAIKNKFKQMSKYSNIGEIVENSKFVTTDLLDVLDYVVKCFPENYKIFQYFQTIYQINIETLMVPYLPQVQEKKQYGYILALWTWIQDYETIMQRAGIKSQSYLNLKVKIQELLPHFISHNQNLLNEYISNCINSDSKNFNRTFYEETIKQKNEFISQYPSDIFIFINKQAEIIKDQVRGNLFIQFVKCVSRALQEFQDQHTKKLEKQFFTLQNCDNDDIVVDFEYKVILNLNNYNECIKHANQAKEQYITMVPDKYQQTVRKIFLNEVQKKFDSSIPKFVEIIIKIIFMNYNKDLVPALFTYKWCERTQQYASIIIESANQELKSIQHIVNNPINYKFLLKSCYDYFIDIYSQQMIYSIKMTYGLKFSNWVPKRLNLKLMEKFYEKNNMNKKILTKNNILENIKKDIAIITGFVEELTISLSKKTIAKIEERLRILQQLFTRNKIQFSSLLESIPENFPDCTIQLIEAIVCVRQDLDKNVINKIQQILKTKKNPKEKSK